MPVSELTQPKRAGTRKLIIGLRKVATDPRSTPTQRLRACELLMELQGAGFEVKGTKSPPRNQANANKLRSLAMEISNENDTSGITRAEEQSGREKSENVAA